MSSRLAGCLALTGLLALTSSPRTQAPDPVQLRPVHYRDLCAAVRAHLGQVVVVDIWAES